MVSYGAPRSPIVRIVDPETETECPAGTVGEIWTHGENVADGYWGNPESRENTFGATLLGASAGTPEKPWLRTGDLGFFSDDELFIIGRIKDLLIVYGRNHSPDDIEGTISAVTKGRSVAISVPDDGGVEQLVAIVELKKRDESEEAAMQRIGVVKRELTAAISKSHGLGVADLVLVPQGSIPITTSGKVRRRDCLQLYLRDQFARIDAGMRRPEPRMVDDTGAGTEANSEWAQRLRTLRQQQHDLLLAMVCTQAATALGRPSANDIDPDSTFQDLGFDSVKVTEFVDRLEHRHRTGIATHPGIRLPHPGRVGHPPGPVAEWVASGGSTGGVADGSGRAGSSGGDGVSVPWWGGFGGGAVGSGGQWHRRDGVVSGRPWLEPGGFV